MIFPKNTKFEDLEEQLMRVIMSGTTLEQLQDEFGDYIDDLTLVVNSIQRKIKSGSFGDLQNSLKELGVLGNEIAKKAGNQRYEEAAKIRDREKILSKKTGIPFSFRSDMETAVGDFILSLVLKSTLVSENSNLTLLIEPGTASPKDIGELLGEISQLYRLIGGSGIKFKPEEIKYPKYAY